MGEIKRKTKVEIIEEVAAFYNTSNRGVIERISPVEERPYVSCVYYNPDSQQTCAVGRYIQKDILLKDYAQLNDGGTLDLDEDSGLLRMIDDLGYKTLDGILVEEVRGHDIEFWNQMQSFHDRNSNWNEHGLTEEGEKQKLYLLSKYENQ